MSRIWLVTFRREFARKGVEARLQGVKSRKFVGANRPVGIYGRKVRVVFVLAVELLGYDKRTLNSCQATPSASGKN